MSADCHHTDSTVATKIHLAMQAGLTLVELMIAIVLGLLVVLVAIGMLISTKSTYTHHDAGTRADDTGRYALEIITRALHQTAYENWDTEGTPIVASDQFTPNIQGLDATDIGKTTTSIESPFLPSVNGSDVLALRYFGSGTGPSGDHTVLNCAGYGVAAPATVTDAAESRGWSIFHVTIGDSGEPELRCKYKSEKGWASAAIVTGVESFQVLYGVDTDGDGMPNTYLNATGVDALDASLTLIGADAAAQAADKLRRTHWKKVVVVKIGMLVRAASPVNPSTATAPYDLFGAEYGATFGATDQGVRLKEENFPTSTRNRLRKVFTQTIQLRNPTAGGGT